VQQQFDRGAGRDPEALQWQATPDLVGKPPKACKAAGKGSNQN
jgi:hypothetical protein